MRETWTQILADLVPSDKPDPDGVPVAVSGLEKLIAEIDRFLSVHQSQELKEIHSTLAKLLQENKTYADETDVNSGAEWHAKWRNTCKTLVAHLNVLQDACWQKYS